MKNLNNEYFAIETRMHKMKDEETKLDGRFLCGFRNNTITEEMILEILDNSSFDISTIDDRTTMVHCVLPNGYVLVETSTCIDKATYDEAVGAEICIKRIENKLWELLGFLHMTALNGFQPIAKSKEDIIDEALSLAFDEILEEENGLDVDVLVGTRYYEKHKAKLLSSVGAELKASLMEIVEGEELSLDDLIELIVGLYLATK